MKARFTPTLLVFSLLPVWACLALRWSRPAPMQSAQLGRQVYVGEGCIHCHSQFVRAGTRDELAWGRGSNPSAARQQVPALIGNRRQGPDLTQAGLRLSRDWHRMHLIDPRRVAPQSRMPSYAHLFADGDPRGEALLDYLMTLGREDAPAARPTRRSSAIAAPLRTNGARPATAAPHDEFSPRVKTP